MKLNFLGVNCTLWLWAVLAITSPAAAQTKSMAYELVVGGNVHEVALGVPFTIVTAAGEKLTAVFHVQQKR